MQEAKKRKIVKIDREMLIILSKCAVCHSKKLRFIKEQEASVLLSNLALKTLFNKIPLLGYILL